MQEGATLIADLLRRVDKIEGYKEEVVPYEKARTETIKARIRENLAQLDVEVDSNRLEQEMIFYLEKLDITEEKVRLQNHCRYFREVAEIENSSWGIRRSNSRTMVVLPEPLGAEKMMSFPMRPDIKLCFGLTVIKY